MKRNLHFLVLVLVGAVAASFSSQYAPDGRSHLEKRQIYSLEDTALVRLVSMGHSGFVSSLSWVECILTYSSLSDDSSVEPALQRSLLLTIAADPRWSKPFEFAGLAYQTGSPKMDSIAYAFLREGVRRFPDDWRMRVTLAMGMPRSSENDSIGVAVLSPLLRHRGEIPPFARTLALSLMKERGQGGVAGAWMVDAILHAKDPSMLFVYQRRLGKELTRSLAIPIGTANEAAAGLIESLRLGTADEKSVASRTIVRVFSIRSASDQMRQAFTAPGSGSSKSP